MSDTAPTRQPKPGSLLPAVEKRPDEVPPRLAHPAQMAEEGEPWRALAESYRTYNLDRKNKRRVGAIREAARSSGIIDDLRAAVRRIVRGERPSLDVTQVLPESDDEFRLGLLLLLFSNADVCRLVELPRAEVWTTETEAEIAALGLHLDTIRKFVAKTTPSRRVQSFQRDLLDHGGFTSDSVVSGQPVTSTAGLYLQITPDRPHICYYVSGGRPYFIITRSKSGDLGAIYLPDENVMIGPEVNVFFRHGIAASLKALMVLNPELTADYLSSAAPKTVALLFGTMHHLGHTFLNEYDGLIQSEDLLDRVEVVLTGTARFLPHQAMFPALETKRTLAVSGMNPGYVAVAQDHLLPVRPTTSAYLLSRKLAERIEQAARSLNPRASEAFKQASACAPLIWFELRTNDRVWISQASGIAAITNHLAQSFPNLGIILAGWSRLESEKQSNEDLTNIAADQKVAEEIRGLLRPGISVFTTIGVSTSEKVVWSTLAHTFVAVFSSGVLFPLGIGRISGVVHANRGFHARCKTGKLAMIEDCPKFLPIDIEDIVDVDQGAYFKTQNHDVQWRVIADALGKLMHPAAA